MIGTPVATAALKAPSWSRTPSSREVPSGKINTDSPFRRNSSITCACAQLDPDLAVKLEMSIRSRNAADEGHAANFPPSFETKRLRHAQPQHQGKTSK